MDLQIIATNAEYKTHADLLPLTQNLFFLCIYYVTVGGWFV